jgi:hypothetical protein
MTEVLAKPMRGYTVTNFRNGHVREAHEIKKKKKNARAHMHARTCCLLCASCSFQKDVFSVPC